MGDERWGPGTHGSMGAALSLPESVAMENPVRQSRAFFAPSGASDAASQPARDGFPPAATHAHSRSHGMDSRRDPHCVARPWSAVTTPVPIDFKPWSLLAFDLVRSPVYWTGLDWMEPGGAKGRLNLTRPWAPGPG